MCGVEDLSVKLRQRRLKWFGHVKRAEMGVVGEVRVEGQRPVGSRRKNYLECDCLMDDVNLLGVEVHVAQN